MVPLYSSLVHPVEFDICVSLKAGEQRGSFSSASPVAPPPDMSIRRLSAAFLPAFLQLPGGSTGSSTGEGGRPPFLPPPSLPPPAGWETLLEGGMSPSLLTPGGRTLLPPGWQLEGGEVAAWVLQGAAGRAGGRGGGRGPVLPLVGGGRAALWWHSSPVVTATLACTVQCTVYTIQCTLYSVQCTV